MAKKTYYGVYQRGKLVEYINSHTGTKMPVIFLSKKAAQLVATSRTKGLKKPNFVKSITI